MTRTTIPSDKVCALCKHPIFVGEMLCVAGPQDTPYHAGPCIDAYTDLVNAALRALGCEPKT